MSPLSYFGRRRCGKNARYLYALVFDLDGVGMPQLRDTLHQMNKDILPQATFVVNSGTGLHLYYVLKEPIPMYPHNQKCLKELKYSLTRQIWNRYTSTIKEPQVQGIFAGLPCGRFWFQIGPGVSSDGLSARRAGDAGGAAGVYTGQ